MITPTHHLGNRFVQEPSALSFMFAIHPPSLRSVATATPGTPISDNFHRKHLLPVGTQPLIGHIMQALKECSVNEVFTVVGYRKDQIQSAIGNGDRYGIDYQFLVQS